MPKGWPKGVFFGSGNDANLMLFPKGYQRAPESHSRAQKGTSLISKWYIFRIPEDKRGPPWYRNATKMYPARSEKYRCCRPWWQLCSIASWSFVEVPLEDLASVSKYLPVRSLVGFVLIPALRVVPQWTSWLEKLAEICKYNHWKVAVSHYTAWGRVW